MCHVWVILKLQYVVIIISLNSEASVSTIPLCQDGEKKGISPEEVYTSLSVSQDPQPWRWMKSDLPRILTQIQNLVCTASLQSDFSRSSAVSNSVLGMEGSVKLLLQNEKIKNTAVHLYIYFYCEECFLYLQFVALGHK